MTRWRPQELEQLSEDTQRVLDVLNNESDLACVLIGTSYLAELLASMLKAKFNNTSVADKILGPQRGVIGGFATRCDLAYCLALITKDIYQDLIKIAEIRNRFAHKHVALSFDDSDVQYQCSQLRAWRIILDNPEDESPEVSTQNADRIARNQFVLSVVLLGSRIHVDALGLKHNG